MVIGGVITLTGSAQNLATALGFGSDNPVARYPVGWLSLQADASNANAVFIGAAEANLSTNYQLRIEKPTTNIPDAPLIVEDAKGMGLLLNSLWVLGTNNEKLRVLVLTV